MLGLHTSVHTWSVTSRTLRTDTHARKGQTHPQSDRSLATRVLTTELWMPFQPDATLLRAVERGAAAAAASHQRASTPSARQHSVKQLAHSPQRPLRVRSSFAASLNRGKRVVPPHAAQWKSSTREPP